MWPFLILIIHSVSGGRTEVSAPSYFSPQALAPIDPGLRDHSELSAESCKSCHQQEHRDWSKSRHALAYTNQNFLEGYSRETQDRCLFCHAPLREQVREIKTQPELKLAKEGVNCVACHVRAGTIQSATRTGSVYHPFKKNELLKDPKFCSGCHEFNINESVNGKLSVTEVNAQSTYSEWLAYRNNGGTKTCQNCHMPEGRHLFHGAHHPQGSPLQLEVTRRGNRIRFNLSNPEVGHNFPSGDVFRRVTIEVREAGQRSFRVIGELARTYQMVDGLRLLRNTTLAPGAHVTVDVLAKKTLDYRVVYHFMPEAEKPHSLTRPDERERVLHTGSADPEGRK